MQRPGLVTQTQPIGLPSLEPVLTTDIWLKNNFSNHKMNDIFFRETDITFSQFYFALHVDRNDEGTNDVSSVPRSPVTIPSPNFRA